MRRDTGCRRRMAGAQLSAAEVVNDSDPCVCGHPRDMHGEPFEIEFEDDDGSCMPYVDPESDLEADDCDCKGFQLAE